MKKLIFLSCIVLAAAGCNNGTPKDAAAKAKDSAEAVAAAPAAKLDYAYTLSKPYQNWQAGDQKHAVTVLKAIKDYETGNIAACAAAFADSTEVRFDHYYAKLGMDSLKKMFTQWRGDYTSLKIDMQDWEPVISSDKKEEWVTVWYKQSWVDKKGKADSMAVVDDFKMINGKIAILDEKIQHYPAAKK